jgi:DNA polymerase-1
LTESKNKRVLLLDIEADGLRPTTVWVVCCLSLVDGKEYAFRNPISIDSLFSLIDAHDSIVAHNGVHYDFRVLEELLGIVVPLEKQCDTLVLSQLLKARRPDGHSLEAWGTTLGFPKQEFSGDFSKYSEEMEEYCVNDVRVLKKLYLHLMSVIERNPGVFDRAIEVEHHSRYVGRLMNTNGFYFDIDGAIAIYKEIETRVQELLSKMQEVFPPKVEYIQLKTKVKEIITPFNPGSTKQVIERMWELGWKPTSKTKGALSAPKEKREHYEIYGWKVDEENMATLPEDAPEAARHLVEYILLNARLRTLSEWMENYNCETHRIHGDFNSLGTVTHRMSHSHPNMGNIATKKTIKYNSPHLRALAIEYGGRMRSLWQAPPDKWLVGTDMEGAHLRIFAHLIDDKEFTQALISGKKEDGTDPHSKNKNILGSICVDRDRAKTFIFSYLNGARAPKVSQIFGCSFDAAKKALSTFERSYSGLARIKQTTIPSDAEKGYFVAVDGRYVVCDGEHTLMGMYLQNMEATLMKYANKIWMEEATAKGIKFNQVNMVHDEFVTEVWNKEDAVALGSIQCDAIRKAGEMFNLRCPFAGESKIGRNWLEVH